MFKIIQTLALVIMIVLFPPAALITISQNAVPGEMTYPLKLKLEDAVLFVASFTPVTKAWFALAQTNRRYAEASALLDQGINASESLERLVAQADITAGDIQRVQNVSQKEQIIGDLTRQITTYNESLSQSQIRIDNKLTAQGFPQPSPQSTPEPGSTVAPTQTPKPSGKSETVELRETPAPSQTASPTPRPTPSPQDQELIEQQRALEEARRRLEELKKKLEEEQKKLQEQAKNTQQSPTPTPSPSRTPTPTPSPTPKPSPSPSRTPIPSPSPSPSARSNYSNSNSLNSDSMYAASESQPSPSATPFNPKWNKTDSDPNNDNDNGDDD